MNPPLDAGAADVLALARQARVLAHQVRERASELGSRSENLPWRSPAAVAMRDQATERQHALRVVGSELEALADALGAHAGAASQRADELLRLTQQAAALAETGVGTLTSGFDARLA